MKTEFFMAMLPPTVTQQEHQVAVLKGKPHFYEPKELEDAQAKLEAYLAKYAPQRPMKGPVRLVTKWCYPITGKHKNGEWKTTKPDTDNMIKMMKDVMTKLKWWNDDAQVASEVTEKFWAEMPGIYILAEEISNGD